MITNKTNPIAPTPVSPLLQRATSALAGAATRGFDLDEDSFETAPTGALGKQKGAQGLQLAAAKLSGVSLAHYHMVRAIQANSPGAS